MTVFYSTMLAMWPVAVLLVIIGMCLRMLGMSRIGSVVVVAICLLWIPYSVSKVQLDGSYPPGTPKETIWYLYQSRHQQLAYDKLTGELVAVFAIGFALMLWFDKSLAKKQCNTTKCLTNGSTRRVPRGGLG